MNKLNKDGILETLKDIISSDSKNKKDSTEGKVGTKRDGKTYSSRKVQHPGKKPEQLDLKKKKEEQAAKKDIKNELETISPQAEIKEYFDHERATIKPGAIKDTAKEFAKGLGADMAIAAITAIPNPVTKVVGAGLGIAKGIHDKLGEREKTIDAAEAQALKESEKKAKEALKSTQHDKK